MKNIAQRLMEALDPKPTKAPTIADYSPITKRQVAILVRHLELQIQHAMELGCTCGDRSKGHQPGCTGVGLTKEARAFLTRLSKGPR